MKMIRKGILIAGLLTSAYLLGTCQVKTETVTEIKEVEKVVEVVPDGYIKLTECIPLKDIGCYFINSYDYPCFELKDVGNQLDDPDNRSYEDIMKDMDDVTEEYNNNFVDMEQVTDFKATENGLQLYLKDGTGYFWER